MSGKVAAAPGGLRPRLGEQTLLGLGQHSAFDAYRALRTRFTGVFIANNGYDLARAQAAVSTGHADLIAFGTPFLANPDLVRRYQENLPLIEAEPATFYVGGEAGYTDYPFYRGDGAQTRGLATATE
ncbi:oxidoreductase [Streptomyces sp. NPDC002076]